MHNEKTVPITIVLKAVFNSLNTQGHTMPSGINITVFPTKFITISYNDG
jgi:hypothetical protein